MEERLTDMEIRYTHQARLVEELNAVVNEQRILLQKLDGRVRDLEKRLMSIEDPHPNEPPPHY